jgi:L-fucose mutarotase
MIGRGAKMLRGISHLISPEMLRVLSEMGHGDEIVLADANFPTETFGRRSIRADGIACSDLLNAILPLFPLDQYDASNFVLMEVVPGDPYNPVIWEEFKAILIQHEPEAQVQYMERFAFYERAMKAYAVVATGEKAQYANIILKKGVVK